MKFVLILLPRPLPEFHRGYGAQRECSETTDHDGGAQPWPGWTALRLPRTLLRERLIDHLLVCTAGGAQNIEADRVVAHTARLALSTVEVEMLRSTP